MLNGSHFSLRSHKRKTIFCSVKTKKLLPFDSLHVFQFVSFFTCPEFRFRRRCGDLCVSCVCVSLFFRFVRCASLCAHNILSIFFLDVVPPHFSHLTFTVYGMFVYARYCLFHLFVGRPRMKCAKKREFT